MAHPEMLSSARDTEHPLKSNSATHGPGAQYLNLTRRSRRGGSRTFLRSDFATRFRYPERRTARGLEQVKPLTREGDRDSVTGADFVAALDDGTHLMAGQRAHEISLRSDLLDQAYAHLKRGIVGDDEVLGPDSKRHALSVLGEGFIWYAYR